MIVLRLLWWLTVRVVAACFVLLRAGVRHLAARRRNTHGSARWASLWDLLRSGVLLARRGIIVGYAWGRFIRYRGDGAVLVYAPMGTGKTSGIVLPALLDDVPRTIICTDPKGECAAVAGRWRARFGPVWRLDAIDPATSHRLNPLDLIRTGTHHEADDAALIAELLVIAESSEAHWDSSAKQLITALIRHLIHAYPPPLRTLASLRELVASESGTLAELLDDMSRSPLPSVAEEARITLASLGSPEMTSILKNAAKCLSFWSKDRVGGMLTSASDFNLLDMHTQTKTIFVSVPEDKLGTYRPFLRMMMGCALAAAVRGKEFAPPKVKPLLLIEECATLGYLESLASGLGYLRAYVSTLLVFQDLGQLKRIYGVHGARTFMAAAGCQVAFNVNDNETARELAEAIGMTTINTRSHGTSEKGMLSWTQTIQHGLAEAGRYLVDPSEIRRIRPTRCIILLSGCLPILARKVRHYRVWRWRKRWDVWRERGPAEPSMARTS